MAVGTNFLGQYSVFCVFGLVGGCVVVPLITQSFETMFFSALVVGLATVSKLQLSKAQGVEGISRQKEKELRKPRHVIQAELTATSRARKRKLVEQDPESVRRKREEELKKAEDEQQKDLERREEEKKEKRRRKKLERQKRKEQEKLDKERELQLFHQRLNRPRPAHSSTQSYTMRGLTVSSKAQELCPEMPAMPQPSSLDISSSAVESSTHAAATLLTTVEPSRDARWQPVAPLSVPQSVSADVNKSLVDLRPTSPLHSPPRCWNSLHEQLKSSAGKVKSQSALPQTASSEPCSRLVPVVPVEEVVNRALAQSTVTPSRSVPTTTTSMTTSRPLPSNTRVVVPLSHESGPPSWQVTNGWTVPDPLPMPTARKDQFQNSVRATPQPVATVNPIVRVTPATTVYAGKPHLSPSLHKPVVPIVTEAKAPNQERFYSLFGEQTSFGTGMFGPSVFTPHQVGASPTW